MQIEYLAMIDKGVFDPPIFKVLPGAQKAIGLCWVFDWSISCQDNKHTHGSGTGKQVQL